MKLFKYIIKERIESKKEEMRKKKRERRKKGRERIKRRYLRQICHNGEKEGEGQVQLFSKRKEGRGGKEEKE